MHPTTIAIDVAKNVFQIAIAHTPGKVAEEHRVTRGKLLQFFAQQPEATVVLEACGTAHHWARQLRKLGHTPVLLPPAYVAPHRRGQKNDRNDARAILEAACKTDIKPVPVKTEQQQTLTALHRLRSQWKHDRTARINGLRGVLRELGFFIPVGARNVLPHVWQLIEDADSGLPQALRHPLAEACLEIQELAERMKAVEKQLEALARQMPDVQRIQTIPGIGLLTATALVAFLGDARRFPTSRHLAAFLGLTPKENSSGYKTRLGRISKKGDPYLRSLLVLGAGALLINAKKTQEPDRLKAWALNTEKRLHRNKAVCAVANKLARITWAVWTSEESYCPNR